MSEDMVLRAVAELQVVVFYCVVVLIPLTGVVIYRLISKKLSK